jgi:hypothetical protein
VREWFLLVESRLPESFARDNSPTLNTLKRAREMHRGALCLGWSSERYLMVTVDPQAPRLFWVHDQTGAEDPIDESLEEFLTAVIMRQTVELSVDRGRQGVGPLGRLADGVRSQQLEPCTFDVDLARCGFRTVTDDAGVKFLLDAYPTFELGGRAFVRDEPGDVLGLVKTIDRQGLVKRFDGQGVGSFVNIATRTPKAHERLDALRQDYAEAWTQRAKAEHEQRRVEVEQAKQDARLDVTLSDAELLAALDAISEHLLRFETVLLGDFQTRLTSGSPLSDFQRQTAAKLLEDHSGE